MKDDRPDNFANPHSEIRNRLAEATGLEPARALRDDLANRCHTVRRRLQKVLSQEKFWRKGQESNLQATDAR